MLSASTGTWSSSPSQYDYQWKRCIASVCTAIAGADGATYMLAAMDVGATLRVVVGATNEAARAAAESRSTAIVIPATSVFTIPPPRNVTAPVLVGRMRVGHRLHAWSGVWAHEPTFFTYEWLRCWPGRRRDCEIIEGAYGPAYHPTPYDVGYLIVSVVTAWSPAGHGTAVAGLKNRAKVRFTRVSRA